MKSFRKALAIILFIVIGFPMSMAGLTVVSMQKWFKDGSSWKALVRNERFGKLLASDEIPGLMPAEINVAETNLDGPALAASILKEIDASVFADAADSAIDDVFRFVEGKSSGELPAFASGELKQALSSKSGAIAKRYITLSGEQANEKAVKAVLEKTISGIPDSIALLPEDTKISLTSAEAQKAGTTAGYTIFGAAGLLVAFAFLAEGSWKKRAVFLGSTMMAPCLLVLIAGYVPYLFSPAGMLRSMMNNPLSDFPLTLEYARYVLTSLSSGFRGTGIAGVVLAVALMSARFLHDGDGEA